MTDNLIDEANSDDAESQYELAWQYHHGKGREENQRQAARWFRRAADQGHPIAQAYLAHIYETGEGLKKSPKRAFAWLQQAAEGGVVWAQVKLATAYWFGEGTDEDDEQAVKWFTLAATTENASAAEKGSAQYYLGIAYRDGFGVSQDLEQSVSWFSKSANNGFPTAKFELSTAYFKGIGVCADEQTALDYLSEAATLGHSEAQFHLGVKLLRGDPSPEQIESAIEWIKKSASKEYPQAQLRLGRMYMGVDERLPEDPDKAFEWVRKAAENGIPEAVYLAARFFIYGYGVSRNMSAGRDLMKIAAEMGHAPSQFEHYRWLTSEGEEQDKEALSWLLKAVVQEYPPALTRMGFLYNLGKPGLPRITGAQADASNDDRETGREFIRMAAELDEPVAQFFLGVSKKNAGCYSEARSWLCRAGENFQTHDGGLFVEAVANTLGVLANEMENIQYAVKAELAEIYLADGPTIQDRAQAIEYIEELAENRSGYGARAFSLAGLFSAEGRGFSQDPERAARFFALSAVRDDPAGKMLLGDACEFGRGVPKDTKEAIRWYKSIVDISLGSDPGVDIAAAVEKLVHPFFKGLGPVTLAQCFRHGILAVPPTECILDLFGAGRATGLPLVDYHIGNIFELECPEGRHLDDAINAFRRAAERGHRESQFRLARALFRTEPDPRSVDEALALLEAAISQGSTEALCELGTCFLDGRNVPVDPAQGLDLLQRAAYRGDPSAHLILGRAYLDGRGLVQDLGEAYVWLNLAAAFNQADAVAQRDRVAEALTKAQLRKFQSKSTEIFRTIIDEQRTEREKYQRLLSDAKPTISSSADTVET